ncbi:MAG: DoxX family protein [Kineosporiaceae bacterium]
MNIALWIVAALLALVFLGAGASKVLQPRSKLVTNPNLKWTEDFSEPQLKAIGALEVLGAIGLVLPPLVGVAEVLSPLAAVGLALTMVGAIVVHLRRKESQVVPVNLVLLALAVFVAWGRFGDYPF